MEPRALPCENPEVTLGRKKEGALMQAKEEGTTRKSSDGQFILTTKAEKPDYRLEPNRVSVPSFCTDPIALIAQKVDIIGH